MTAFLDAGLQEGGVMHYHKYRLIIPFLLPASILYGVFVVWPYLQAMYISLTGWRGLSDRRPFVGLDNYQRSGAGRAFPRGPHTQRSTVDRAAARHAS